MTKKAPYLLEIGIGLLLTATVAYSYHKRTGILETTSLKTFDLWSKSRTSASNTDSIKIVEIDGDSVASVGRWPWPRSLVAQLVDSVVGAGAQVIGLNVLFIEPDQNQGLEELSHLHERYSEILEKNRPLFARKKVPLKDFQEFLDNDLQGAIEELDGDAIFAQVIEQAVNVVLPMYFIPGDALGNNLQELPAWFEKEKLTLQVDSNSFSAPSGMAADLPMEDFGMGALATGHSNLMPDRDGTIRRIAPAFRYGQFFYPSFGIQLVREFLKLQRDSLIIKPGSGFSLFKANIPIDEDAQTYLQFAGPAGTFKRFSAVDVLSGGIPDGSLKNKIVLIGVTAPGLAPDFVVPSGERFTGLEIWATHMENILGQRFISRPPWAKKAEWAMIALAGLILIALLPLVKGRLSIPISAVVFFAMAGASWFFFKKQGLWVSPAYGCALLLSGFVVMVGKRLIFTEKGKELVEAEGMETNKMLGLSFQGQGMLDLAFEKFRKCPVDASIKELLYNLGLDMERKRQFAKAAAVYEHIATVDEKFKDIKEKIELLKKAGEGAVFGSIGKKGSDSTVVVEGLGQNTTLGRYEVMKELGRGAMGIVYLGKDPKINRQVAIKTLRFEDDVDEEQTKSIKERFFREAESAGNLTHPNIIRIFDAGEDQDVAYIAMELLDGEDLKKVCEKANLLPIERVIDIVAQVASGLDYAHKQGVVHRDIKPANIMMLKDGSLRITDFGIARIQATSKTATGAVLGTPAYMSPEQVNGKKVDGRADIFSLGVTLFEMLTGEKPFAADSIAALLYRIANVDHPDPREFNSKIPADVIPIINKALQKDATQRYQTAGEMAEDLKNCLKNAASGSAKSPSAPQPTPPPTLAAVAPQPVVLPVAPVEPAPEPAPVAQNGLEEPILLPTDADPSATPINSNDFFSELEQAFKLNTIVPPAPPPPETIKEQIEPASEATLVDKTLVQESPKNAGIEKTVVIDPNFKNDDIDVLPSIERGFRPEDLKGKRQDPGT